MTTTGIKKLSQTAKTKIKREVSKLYSHIPDCEQHFYLNMNNMVVSKTTGSWYVQDAHYLGSINAWNDTLNDTFVPGKGRRKVINWAVERFNWPGEQNENSQD